jgi:hypothetical protein
LFTPTVTSSKDQEATFADNDNASLIVVDSSDDENSEPNNETGHDKDKEVEINSTDTDVEMNTVESQNCEVNLQNDIDNETDILSEDECETILSEISDNENDDIREQAIRQETRSDIDSESGSESDFDFDMRYTNLSDDSIDNENDNNVSVHDPEIDEIESDSFDSQNSSKSDKDNDSEHETNSGNQKFKQAEGGATAKKWLNVLEILSAFKNDQNMPVLDSAPSGDKSNLYFLVNNTDNLARRSANLPSLFYDDCGVWDTAKGKTEKIYVNMSDANKPAAVFLKNGVYTRERQIKGKKTYEPLIPQPDTSDVVLIIKYTTVLKRDPKFKKRVTWIDSGAEHNNAIWQYVGTYPITETPHGNAKNAADSYIRTDPVVMKHIKDNLDTKGPSEIYLEANREFPGRGPKSVQQIKDLKVNAKKTTAKKYEANIADDLLAVISMVNDQPTFVQKINIVPGRAPSIICYLKEQIDDLKSFLAMNTHQVLGLDRTFNLGSCYVTTIVYKNLKVIRKDSNDHPVLFGPMLLHFDGYKETYHDFLAHVKSVLDLDFRFGSHCRRLEFWQQFA